MYLEKIRARCSHQRGELDIEDSVEIQITTLIYPNSLKNKNINLSNNLNKDLKRLKEEKEGKGFLTINL